MTRLLLLLAGQASGVALTHALSSPYRAQLDPVWLRSAELADLLISAIHLGAWVVCWWLLLGTLVDLGGAVVDARTARRVAARGRPRLAPAWVQRVVNQAVGATLVLSVAAGPAAAATEVSEAVPIQQVVSPPVPAIGLDPGPEGAPPVEPPPTAEAVDPATTPNPVDPPNTVGPTGSPAVATPAPAVAAPTPPTSPVTPEPAPVEPAATTPDSTVVPAPQPLARDSHTVAAGENLWVIARGALSTGEDRPTDRQVHAYWLRLIEANLQADTVASGDPDLILPGEILTLPAVDVAAAP